MGYLVWLCPRRCFSSPGKTFLQSHLECLLGWVQDFPSEAKVKKEKEAGFRDRGTSL